MDNYADCSNWFESNQPIAVATFTETVSYKDTNYLAVTIDPSQILESVLLVYRDPDEEYNPEINKLIIIDNTEVAAGHAFIVNGVNGIDNILILFKDEDGQLQSIYNPQDPNADSTVYGNACFRLVSSMATVGKYAGKKCWVQYSL